MLNFVLCDDNQIALNKLSKMLESIFIKNNIDACIKLETTLARDVLAFSNKENLDVLLLDINLNSYISGCDIADIIREKNKNIYIIFTTGHLEYALIAYKYKTFDYLPKPIVKDRLEETILRLIKDLKVASPKFIRLDNNKTIINADEINYIKKDGMKLVFCSQSRYYETYSSFNKIKFRLSENFVRCHKSFIVNINNISSVNSSDNIIFFSNNDKCYIGAKYKRNFLERI